MFFMTSKERRVLIIFLVAFVLAFAARFFSDIFPSLPVTLYLGIFIAWGVSVRRRITHKKIRRHLTAVAGLLVLMFFLRELRVIFKSNDLIMVMCLYAYFIPTLMTSYFVFLASQFVDRPEDGKYKKSEVVLGIGLLILLALVFSNDIHHLVYTFEDGNVEVFHRQPVYYIVTVGSIVMGFGGVINTIRKCAVASRRIKWYIPSLLVTFACIPLILFYALGGRSVVIGNVEIFRFQDAYAFLYIVAMESLIQIGYFTSSTGYGDFFRNSRISAAIKSASGEKLISSSTYFDEKKPDFRQRTIALSNGSFTWNEDISPINRLQARMTEVTESLESENDLIIQENELRKERTSYETRNRIYNRISDSCRSQIMRIDDILKSDKEDIRLATVLGAYIKSMSNLMFLSEGREKISAGDIRRAFEESFEYLRLSGKKCSLDDSYLNDMEPSEALKAYTEFETKVEDGFDALSEVSVSFRDGKVRIDTVMKEAGV